MAMPPDAITGIFSRATAAGMWIVPGISSSPDGRALESVDADGVGATALRGQACRTATHLCKYYDTGRLHLV
ncbi:MAG: hypothetical protein WDN04_20115 [Rhodospirillales bacterium]